MSVFRNHLFKIYYIHTMRYCSHKQFRVIQKFLGNSKPKRANWYTGDLQKKPQGLPTPKDLQKGSRSSRRVNVLNKLFMRYITDIMATGQNSSQLLGHGIEVSRVNVTSDFQLLQIYWVGRGSEDDSVVENLLKRTSHELRHELSTLRVMGNVPELMFIKDKDRAKWVQIDKLLQVADFGPDYEPQETGKILKAEFAMDMKLPAAIKKEIDELEHSGDLEQEEPLPPPRQNVFGVNHSQIMARIIALAQKSKAQHRSNPTLPLPLPTVEESTHRSSYSNIPFDKEKFNQYWKKREIDLKKLAEIEQENLLSPDRFGLVDIDQEPGINPEFFTDEDDFIIDEDLHSDDPR